MSATIVTCYYRLSSKHSQSDYDKWIANFMSLDANVVIFGDSDSVPFLKRTYPETTKRNYIIREFSEFQNAKYDWDREVSLNRKPHPGHSAKLFLLWSEKIHFIDSVIKSNPYNTDVFVWMDIGCVRNNEWLPQLRGFPNVHKIDRTRINFLQMAPWQQDDAERAKVITSAQFWNRPCALGGTIFGGGKDAFREFRELYISVLDEVDKNRVFKGEDQDLYAFCALRRPDLVKLYTPLYVGYDEWFSLHLYWSSALRIDIVGPGIMPIPPKGWGAVEILIWDIAQNLRAAGHIVSIHNTKDLSVVYDTIRKTNPDFVHIQYDDYAYLADLIAPYTRAVAITSHYGYLEQPHRWGGYKSNFDCIRAQKADNVYHFVLSEGIKQIYKLFDVQEDHLYVTPNGADESLFRYAPSPAYPDRSIVVGKMEVRKGQWRLMNVDNVWFAGNKSDGSFDYRHPRWLGEWDKPTLYNNLTDYANLVLLSDGEADPLVVKEALIAGLGIVVSTFAAANLDTSLPFITVIPNDKLDDIAYINAAISKNRSISIHMRSSIKTYSKSHTWDARVNDYISKIQQILNRKSLNFSKLPTLPFRQIILWGFSENMIDKTLYSFAQNYSDSNYPVDNDWTNCLFIVNGDAAQVPIEASSTYFIYKPLSHRPYVHSCARYIEVQCLEGLINDTDVFNISQDILYEVKKEPNYEVVYIHKIGDLSIDALSTILSMKTAPIIVTALFDIQREVIDGRSIDDYKKWTLKTLSQIKDPVLIYLDKKIQMRTEILNARRNVGPVKIIYMSLEELDMYKYKETVTNILQSPFFKIKQRYPKDITNLLPSYTLIQHNKFFFISNALKFTHSDTFLWMDAGFSRFMKDKIYKFNFENPTKFMISCEMKNAHLISDITFDNYIGTNTRILAGGLFVCPRNYVHTIKELVLDIWEKEMIHKNRIDNEQITLGLVCKTHRQQFELYESIFDVCFS